MDYTTKHNLDVIIDVRKKKKMEKNWLRLLRRIPCQYYLRVAKELRIQSVMKQKHA